MSDKKKVEEFLKSLGWPESDLDKKGELVWSRPPHFSKRAELRLTVYPDSIEMRFDMGDLDSTPHYSSRWSINEVGEVSMVSATYAGTPIMNSPQASHDLRAIAIFQDFRSLMSTEPTAELLGSRVKSPPKPGF